MSADVRAYLQIRAASAPLWIDGGERVAYLASVTGIPQLWAVPAAGGWADQLTFGEERVAAAIASPDGRRIAFQRDRGGNERHGLVLLEGEDERPLTDADAIHALGAFSPDGRLLAFSHTARNGVDFDVAVLDLDDGTRVELAQPGSWCAVLDWGEAGILVARARSNVDDDLLLLDPATGATTQLTPAGGEASHVPALLLPDGTVLAGCDRGGEFRRLATIRGGVVEPLAPDEADVDAMAVAGPRRAWVENRDGFGVLHLDGPPVDGLPPGIPGGLAFAPDGRRLALHLAQAGDTTDVWIVGDGAPRRLTRSATGGVPRSRLVAPELGRFASHDGLEVPYFRFGPAEAPTVVWVHGGPESQFRPELNPVVQLLAAEGLTVVAPNIRGSTGYGRTYTSLDDVELRHDANADLAALARHLGAERGVPIGVMGGSYGGYATLAALVGEPDLWRAGVDIVGIASLVTFLERTGAYRRALREAEYGSLEDDRDVLEALSPLTRVDRITAPLLVIHGANDPRVPVGEAEQIVAALRGRGRVVEYLRYEDEGHGLVRLPNRIEAYGRVAAFLGRHLLGRDGG